MILDQEKWGEVLRKKIEKYTEVVSSRFFELNDAESPCSLSDKAAVLYELKKGNITYKEEDFEEADHLEVDNFVKCLETQMDKLMKGQLKPVDLSLEEIKDILAVTPEEVEGCCMSSEDVLKLMNGE